MYERVPVNLMLRGSPAIDQLPISVVWIRKIIAAYYKDKLLQASTLIGETLSRRTLFPAP